MDTVVPLLAALVSLAFAIAVLDQYFARRKPYQLLWAVGLFMYAIATACEFVVGAWGLKEVPYRLWYLFGAIFVAAYLGMGTLFLLASRRTARIVLAFLLVASILAAVRLFTAPVDLAQIVGESTMSGKAFPPGVEGPRFITPIFNVFGAVTLIGGALYSAWAYWRRRIMPQRVLSNILVAVGAILPVAGGILARAGVPEYLYLLELLGIIIIFAGFLRNREVFGLYRFPLVHGFRRQPD